MGMKVITVGNVQHQNQGKAVEHPVDIMFLLEQAAIRRINGTVVGKRSAKYTL